MIELLKLSPIEVEYLNRLLRENPALSLKLYSEHQEHWVIVCPPNKWAVDAINEKRALH